MGLHTPLYDQHLAADARLVDFGGWDMPLNYGSQLAEHEAVRTTCGVFDVSHMTVVDVSGAGSRDFLRRIFANDIARIAEPGRALYGCMLTEAGGIIDDLIVYWRGGERYRLIVNAATRDKDLGWLAETSVGSDVEILERADLAMLAVQGPNARNTVAELLPAVDGLLKVRRFGFIETGETFCARTGYTGEDGFEIVLPAEAAAPLWDQLVAAGVAPCGLGARDSLRLEAGLGLYGSDMDETTHPYESNLGWTIDTTDPERQFIGRDAIAGHESPARVLTGLVLAKGGVLRAGQRVLTSAGEGVITSGGFGPTVQQSVALARMPAQGADAQVSVDIRGKEKPVQVVAPPFVRGGKATY